ncbi:pyridoxamine 5'-phosphate oxidase family protein [Anaerovorax sp. IOR16]|uniref:pyridoxamine 5'-phosphate oxidase family protein n=1 Tax=Anaerovorax sp. IOR16 TaxID=2773458 RepID=UPI0019CFA693|nr:pyridoxamine 5'-phosphate oxidase family protein [Anaerovorax sp. IOR16]
MFREMRRKEKQLPMEETIKMLEKMSHGTLALAGDDGYPYSLPISYAYKDNKIYFHGAMQGHKIDSIIKEPKVSFSVIEQDTVLPEKFDTVYRSAVIFGKARILKDKNEKRAGLMALIEKYSSAYIESGEKYIDKAIDAVNVIEIVIDHMTGKEGK